MEMNKNIICSIMDMAYYAMMSDFDMTETGKISIQHGYIINAIKLCKMCVEEKYHVCFTDHDICEQNGFKPDCECVHDELIYIYDNNNYIGYVNDYFDIYPNEIWIDGKFVENDIFKKYGFLENE